VIHKEVTVEQHLSQGTPLRRVRCQTPGELLAPLDRCHIFDRTQAVIYAVREGVIDVGDLEYRPPREPLP
jgi:hypothetical protein